MVEGEQTPSVDPKEIVYAAINAERRENPDCPVASMLEDLLVMYRAGDEGALRLAIDIAKDTLAPRPPGLLAKLRNLISHRPSTKGTK